MSELRVSATGRRAADQRTIVHAARGLWIIALALAMAGCAARGAAGASCTRSDQCADGLACVGGSCRATCATDRDCASGMQCRASASTPGQNTCVPLDAPPLCRYASDCAPPTICALDGVCRAPCASDAECASGTQCRASVASPTARACVAPSVTDPCASASPCSPPLVCARDGVCRAECQADLDCRTGTPQSASAVCMAGVCVSPPGDGGATGDGGGATSDAGM